MSSGQKRLLMLIATAAVGAFACGIEQDELSCEEAVAHLADCCPGFSTSISCQRGCDGNGTTTAYDINVSQCIREKSCDELRSTDVCTRARDPYAYQHTGVCP